MDRNETTLELLAPAGNLEKLKTVLRYGADAAYLGAKKYGLRAYSDNFTKRKCVKVGIWWVISVLFVEGIHNFDKSPHDVLCSLSIVIG